MDLYEALGIDKSANPETIRKAYRKLAQQHHPDKETGNMEKFQMIQHAFAVLSDSERKEDYDRTGFDGTVPGEKEKDFAALAELLLSTLEQVADPSKVNIVDYMTGHLSNILIRCSTERRALEQKIAKVETVIARFKDKSNLTLDILKQDIHAKRKQITFIDEEDARANRLLILLNDCEYEVDQVQATSMFMMNKFRRLLCL